MKAEHIDALHALARDDAAVCAVLHAKYASGMDWEETLVGLVLHLTQEKASLTSRLIDAARNRPTAG